MREERLLWGVCAFAPTAYTGPVLYYLLNPDAALGFPSLPDAMAVVFYCGAMASAVLFVKSRLAGIRNSLWQDGVIGGLALSALVSLVVFRAAHAGSGVESRIIDGQLGYAISDVFILGFLGAIALLGGWRLGLAGCGLLGAFSLLAIGDKRVRDRSRQRSSGSVRRRHVAVGGWCAHPRRCVHEPAADQQS